MNSLNEFQLKEQLIKKLIHYSYDSLSIAVIKTCCTIGITQYIRSIQKNCLFLKINLKIYDMENQAEEALQNLINSLNQDNTINGIVICLPLAPYLDQEKITNQISPHKDIDCLTNQNLDKISLNQFEILPSLVSALIELFAFNHVKLKNQNILILNKTKHLGLPLQKLLTYNRGNVQVCNSKTPHIKGLLKQADIVIIATKNPIELENHHLKPGVTLIDINESKPDYRNYTNIENLSTNIGSITTLKLIENLYALAKK